MDNESSKGDAPLLTSPTFGKRGSTTTPFVWGLVGTLVALGTVNFVLLSTLYKSYTDEYSFFVNQAINLMYVVMGGLVLYPKQLFTNEINVSTDFPQRKFVIMGFLDSLGTLLTALGAVHTPSTFQPLLNQTLIPFTIFFSRIFLGARYHRLALVGASCIVAGASLTVLSCATGDCKNTDVDVKWYSIVIYLLSNVPMALSAVYKEIAFKDVQVNVWYLCQWVSIYQFLLSWLYLPITVLPEFAGNGWNNLWPHFTDGLRCTLGGVECDSFAFPFPCKERRGTLWLLLAYCVVNFTFNWIGLLLTKYGSATIRSISYAIILPATSMAFCLPLMGDLKERLTPFVPVAIVVVLMGFALYQRYADALDEEGEKNDDDDDDSDKAEPQKRLTQPTFSERTGGLDITTSRVRSMSFGSSGCAFREKDRSTPLLGASSLP